MKWLLGLDHESITQTFSFKRLHEACDFKWKDKIRLKNWIYLIIYIQDRAVPMQLYVDYIWLEFIKVSTILFVLSRFPLSFNYIRLSSNDLQFSFNEKLSILLLSSKLLYITVNLILYLFDNKNINAISSNISVEKLANQAYETTHLTQHRAIK